MRYRSDKLMVTKRIIDSFAGLFTRCITSIPATIIIETNRQFSLNKMNKNSSIRCFYAVSSIRRHTL